MKKKITFERLKHLILESAKSDMLLDNLKNSKNLQQASRYLVDAINEFGEIDRFGNKCIWNLDHTFYWNYQIRNIFLYKGKVMLSVYVQFASTDEDLTVPLSDVLDGGNISARNGSFRIKESHVMDAISKIIDSLNPREQVEFVIENGILIEYKGEDSTVIIPNNVKKIGDNVFADNHNLRDVILPNGLMEIGDRSFARCDKLTRIIFPDTIKKIGSYAFSDCDGFTSIKLPKDLVEIGRGAFNCKNLERVIFMSNVKMIEDLAFKYTKLDFVELPDGCKFRWPPMGSFPNDCKISWAK